MEEGAVKLRFQPLTTEVDALVRFLTSESWDYHGNPNPSAAEIREVFKQGYYTGEDVETFWIVIDSGRKIGLIRIFDLQDPTPLFDIRITRPYRGMGIGEKAVKWLTHHVFTHHPGAIRIEGRTRKDNYAMRKVFFKCGYVREAYHRKAWPSSDGTLHDSVGYGITREDWEENKVTPVDWGEVPF